MARSMSDMADFEDAVQTACAILISRDRHFVKCPMAVYSPEEFLSRVL